MIEGTGFVSRYSWPRPSPKSDASSKKVIGNEVFVVKGKNIDLQAQEAGEWVSPMAPARNADKDEPEKMSDFLTKMFRAGYNRYYKSSIL